MTDKPQLLDPSKSAPYILQVHRENGDSWHHFESLVDAAAFALDLMRILVDTKTYPIAIWHGEHKLWRAKGSKGKLHFASTRDALKSLAGAAD